MPLRAATAATPVGGVRAQLLFTQHTMLESKKHSAPQISSRVN
jgi:hypothetical protein